MIITSILMVLSIGLLLAGKIVKERTDSVAVPVIFVTDMVIAGLISIGFWR